MVQYTQNKTLLALFSCHKLDFKHPNNLYQDWFVQQGLRPIWNRTEAIRQTWWNIKDERFDYKMFFGKGAERESLEDEVFLDVPDGYYQASLKIQAICRWALDHGYSSILKLDDDNYVYPERIPDLPEDIDQIGHWQHDYISGFAYWLSERAMKAVATLNTGSVWAEDVFVGHCMTIAGLSRKHEASFIDGCALHSGNPLITFDEIPEDHTYSVLTSVKPEDMVKFHGQVLHQGIL